MNSLYLTISGKSFKETYNFLRSHAIRLDQQYKEKAARQIHNTSQLSNRSKKDKVKKVLALINEIQIQDECSSDEESTAVPPSKTAMVYKLTQITPEIWMTLPLEAKKWLLNERKCQQQENDKMNKSLGLSKSTAVSNEKDTNNSNMPNQYARVKNVAKEEDVIKDNKHHTYGFVDEFLEEAMKSSSLNETDEDVDYEYWSSNHNAHATLSISNSLNNKRMNLLHLLEKYHISILDGGADTCVFLGQGWEVLSAHNTRRANVVGFDHEAAVKRNLPIVSSITAVDLPDGISVILIVYVGIYYDTANHSLLSEFQLRDFGVKIDSICHKHGGTQTIVIQDVGSSLLVPLELAGCMIYFKH
jgi:hypothetical protein